MVTKYGCVRRKCSKKVKTLGQVPFSGAGPGPEEWRQDSIYGLKLHDLWAIWIGGSSVKKELVLDG